MIDVVFKDDFVKCGVIGEFIDEDFLLFFKGIVDLLLIKIWKLNWYMGYKWNNIIF